MLGEEELPGHVGPHPGTDCSGQGSARRQAGRRLDRPDAFGDLEAERADLTINDPERRPEAGRVLVVALGEIRPSQLLLPELGQRVQTAAEQCTHLLRRHRVAGGQAVDPVQAGTDPHPLVSHPARCSRTPALCDLSRSNPVPRPASSSSHTQTRL
jgi:hypothetical protein